MPNWVLISATVKGTPAAITAFVEGVRTPRDQVEAGKDDYAFDFNQMIPMPDSLHVESGSDGDMGYAAVTGDFQRYLSYGRVAQAGVHDLATFRAFLEQHHPRAIPLGEQYAKNLSEHGYKTWYDWANNRWGTKWNACDAHVEPLDDETLKLSFKTAWAFPEPVLAVLAQQYPEVVIEGEVDEEGGYFYGSFRVGEGVLVTDFQEGTRAGGPFDYGDEVDDDDDGGAEGASESGSPAH